MPGGVCVCVCVCVYMCYDVFMKLIFFFPCLLHDFEIMTRHFIALIFLLKLLIIVLQKFADTKL
jgi:hypothetical protein